jgi:hypothetical protein
MVEQDVAVPRQHEAEAQREADPEQSPQDQADPPAVHHVEYTVPKIRSATYALIGCALVLVGGFVFAQLLRDTEPLGLDQGLFACFGRWLRDGWLPYRDIFDSKPPLHLYTWVLAWAGGSPASAWLFEALWLAATLAVAFVVARRWWGAWAGLAAAALLFLGLWAPGLGGYWSRLQAEELLVLPQLGAAWFALRAADAPAGGAGRGDRRAAIACGVLTGVVGLYKIPALVVGGPWLALWLASSDAATRRLARIGWFAAGVAVPWLVACAWFAAHGALADFIDATLFYQRHWIAMLDPPLGDVLHAFATIALRELAPLWLLAALGIALAWRRNRPHAICLAAWIVLASLAVIAQRQLAGYHVLLVVPGLALASAYAVIALAERVHVAAGAVACMLALAVLLRGWCDYGATDLASYRRDTFVPADETAVAHYIAAHTQPGDGILVWALAPGIYALADRHPVTRFPFHRLLLTDARLAHAVPGRDARRAALLARMRSDPPAYIVLGIKDANPFEPDSFTSLAGFRELNAIVQRDYHDVASFGRFVVLARTR